MTTKPRKTIDRDFLVRKANEILSADSTAEARRHVAGFLEIVLMDSGSYKGFGYQSSETDDNGVLRENYDSTRRWYY